MCSDQTRETFFRPDEPVVTEVKKLPASLMNGLRLLVARADGGCVFIPIRSMQYLAIADAEEVVFIDGQGGYVYGDGAGGRLIQIAWQPVGARDSLVSPTPCRMVYYFLGLERVQSRLLVEMGPAVDWLLNRHREAVPRTGGARILPLKQAPRT